MLSLFFIDAVERYRRYEAGNPVKGDYALMVEEEYRRLAGHPDYRTPFEGVDVNTAAEAAHNGYFSIDRKGGWTDTAENNQANRDNAERARIACGRAHFSALCVGESPARYEVATGVAELLASMDAG